MNHPLSGSHVIVCYAYGCMSVEPATVERAMAFFNSHKDYLYPEARQLVDEDHSKTLVIDTQRIADVLRSIALKLDCTASLRNLLYGPAIKGQEDLRPDAVIEDSWRADVLSWFSEGHPDTPILRMSGYHVGSFEEMLEALPWLKPIQDRANLQGKKVVIADIENYELAREYRIIEQGLWKEDAPVERVVARILKFVLENLVKRSDWRHLGVEKIA